jgi:predicted Rossmann fold flavoprotein
VNTEPFRLKKYDLIVVGGGAAGFFGAIIAAETNSALRILILEKTTKLLSKVKVSGGGRCNVTHNQPEPTPFSKHYPRGQKELKSLFRTFGEKETISWFEKHGVKLKAEDDGRMFPVTDDSQTIIDCFLKEAEKRKIEIVTGAEVKTIEKKDDAFVVQTTHENLSAKRVLIATGGYNHEGAYHWIKKSGHAIVKPIPSLFTFNDSKKEFTDLMGLSVPQAEIKIAGTKFSEIGPVLITHWGLSGPAVIKLSAWAAEYLHQQNYEFNVMVNWINWSEETLRETFSELRAKQGKQKIVSHPIQKLPQRLWLRLCELAEIQETKTWAEVAQKNLNRLMEFLIRCPFQIKGKTTFKEEFVTCGGIDLKEINLDTMESKILPGLYFAGEVLNIDGETGGFNFQAAWTTGYLAGKSISTKSNESR